MEDLLMAIFDHELEEGRLRFDSDPEYRDLMHQVQALFPGERDLPGVLFDWMSVSDQISFIHGMRLGIRLGVWAGSWRDL